ncbi:DUF523 domain-containing protein [Bifidobacterium sp.]|jgi:uncharacterized protein YbbK (DUF523 family)|uniref:DUF523 domain-containing protein n=1 Tax=Bifidobacterium sp. TaxID=41200 RepID=UPI0025BEAD30|nr:DUF523 domain-containing protein [Bifidobacterium sp.]MCI1636434.1 DUF523 domain-containing protein [Bifidobacterium sp.]
MQVILVSSCLAGFAVRYDGADARNDIAQWLVERGQAISACPEILGGFAIPRPPAEIAHNNSFTKTHRRVLEIGGNDVTDAYEAGAQRALRIVKRHHISVAFLKDRSPSCGVEVIYDGSFSGVKIPGMGVTAQLFAANGVTVYPDTALSVEAVLPYVDEDLHTELRKSFRTSR